MKTKKISIILLITTLIFLFIACNKTDVDVYEKLHPYVSNCQTSLYTASDDNLDISISSYEKEELFVADGMVQDVVYINSLLIKPKNSNYLNYAYSYTLIGELGSLNGDLQKTALGVSFKDNIDNISEIGNLSKLILKFKDNEIEYELFFVPIKNVDYKKIITMAYKHYEDKLDIDNLQREIFVKLIKDDKIAPNSYFWYVSFLKNTEDYLSLVLDLNGKVISEKIQTN